jgi:hypothetical protein
LYIVTAQHELEGLSDFGMAVQDKIQKPFNNKKLFLLIEEDYLTQKYGKPDLSSIQEDYDHDELKIQHAIQLLLREWESILVKISHSIQSGDREAYRQLVHKMITSVRRLDLIKFEELLNDIDLAFDQGSANTYLSTLQEAMQFYLSSIRKFAKEH